MCTCMIDSTQNYVSKHDSMGDIRQSMDIIVRYMPSFFPLCKHYFHNVSARFYFYKIRETIAWNERHTKNCYRTVKACLVCIMLKYYSAYIRQYDHNQSMFIIVHDSSKQSGCGICVLVIYCSSKVQYKWRPSCGAVCNVNIASNMSICGSWAM